MVIKDVFYIRFKLLIPIEIMTFIRLIILNSLSQSMRFEYKFKSQKEDLIAGNDLYIRMFRKNAEFCWKEFKYYFSHY